MSGPAIRFRTVALMTAIVCLLDALTTAYAFHFVRSDKYVIYEKAALSAEVLRHVLHLGPLATFAALASYLFADFHGLLFCVV
jgi:hypothetical protein